MDPNQSDNPGTDQPAAGTDTGVQTPPSPVTPADPGKATPVDPGQPAPTDPGQPAPDAGSQEPPKPDMGGGATEAVVPGPSEPSAPIPGEGGDAGTGTGTPQGV